MRIPHLMSIFGWVCVFSTAARALPIHESLFFDGVPAAETLRRLRNTPGEKSFLVNASYPSSPDLRTLALVKGPGLTIEVNAYPGPAEEALWRELFEAGTGLVTVGAGLPVQAEIDRMNAWGLPRLTVVEAGYPGPDSMRRIRSFHGELSFTFAGRAYPRLEDRDSFRAGPEGAPLLFIQDYWPWYSHMDLFNMIPQPVRLRVVDIFPSDQHLDYMRHIKRLDRVAVQTDYNAPDPEIWRKLGEVRVDWIAKDFVPDESGLRAFSGSTEKTWLRTLTIDQDWELDARTRDRLERSPVAVRWIHSGR